MRIEFVIFLPFIEMCGKIGQLFKHRARIFSRILFVNDVVLTKPHTIFRRHNIHILPTPSSNAWIPINLPLALLKKNRRREMDEERKIASSYIISSNYFQNKLYVC